MSELIPVPFFVFEMANNHMGDVGHGTRIIREIHKVTKAFPFRFGFKLQYRHLDSFIHPSLSHRDDLRYVKRFRETRLDEHEFRALLDEMRSCDFVTVCTPFDERSVDQLEAHGIEILKIASCSFTDWPLLERIALSDRPLIASTATYSAEEMDRVVSFFEHRRKELALLHCVAEYPTPAERLNLSQIDFLRARYPSLRIGFSTHESPTEVEPVMLAIAKGATVFEKHVGVATDRWPLNAYSASPDQVRSWLLNAQRAFAICGRGDTCRQPSAPELDAIRSLRRGVYARRPIAAGARVTPADMTLAIPTAGGQLTANDLSKYVEYHATAAIAEDEPLLTASLRRVDNQQRVLAIVRRVRKLIKKSGVAVPSQVDLEISHHYGLDRFDEVGLTMITIVNREYCKKLLILLPGQRHPEQFHRQKEETFHLLHGDLVLCLNGEERSLKAGDVVTVERDNTHAFRTTHGAIVEEISSSHLVEDSFYTDPAIALNRDRKTILTFWLD
jgi:sialic acid synthase SpsE/quercetin dioxygenase-like cupin family protein